MMNFPEPNEPTMNVVSLAGRNRETSLRTGMVGLEGYENETLCSASSVEHLEGMISRRGEDFCLDDLAFARMLNSGIHNWRLLAGPKRWSCCKFVISNQFSTEREALTNCLLIGIHKR